MVYAYASGAYGAILGGSNPLAPTMKNTPPLEEIIVWLKKENPFGLFSGDFSIDDIDPKPWSGHFNYLVETPEKKFVLRFKGPEWGETGGINDEYKTLSGVSQYGVGPKAFYFSENFFGESVMFEEHLDGQPLSEFTIEAQKLYFPEVVKTVKKINSIPADKSIFPFRRSLTSYERSKDSWRERINYLRKKAETKEIGEKLAELLPSMEKIVDGFEPLLRDVLGRTGPVFAFESSHIGHCFVSSEWVRFINWEQVSYGDPCYTLAVFLVSISGYPDFEETKKGMISLYLENNSIPEFPELMEQRIKERHMSNIIWLLWRNAKLGAPVVEWEERITKLEKLTNPR